MGDHIARVLVVEDDERIAAMIVKGLRRRGHDVLVAANGMTALGAVDETVDVVLLDLGLPDIDGLEVLRELAKRPSRPAVVVVTARSDPTDRDAAFELGACGYVTKPFRWAAVWDAIDDAVGVSH